mgnify:FL=1
MQRIICLVVVLISTIVIGHNTVAQELKVVSNVDNLPLPFATVTNHSRPSIVSTNINGVVNLKGNIGDTLSVSYIGYMTAVLLFNGDKILVVRLEQAQKMLPEVVIHNCRSVKEFNYDNFKGAKKLKKQGELQKGFGGVIWSKGSNIYAKIALRLNPLLPNATLTDFSFG